MKQSWEGRDASQGVTRELRIVRIVDEFMQRLTAGEPACDQELLAAHPDLAADLREHFDLARQLTRTECPIEDLLRRGILTPTDDPDYVGELGPYRIARVVGQGGMGVVLEAYDKPLRRTVAIKILRPGLVGDPATVARFEREARLAVSLNHAHIVDVHLVGYAQGVPYIAMEFIPGSNLAAHIQQAGPLPAATTRQIFQELMSALAAAHAADLVHRDIKCSNILLAPRAGGEDVGATQVKLADFGLARLRDLCTRLTLTTAVLGTPAYMSPEQARGEEVDQRSDLYSAGVVLYEMLTGQTPFHADTPTATLHRILHETPRDPRKLNNATDRELAQLALRLLEKEPAERFQSANEVLVALQGGYRDRRHLFRRLRTATVAVVVACLVGWGGWRSLLHVVPIDEVRSPAPERRSVLAHRPYLGWSEVFRGSPDTEVMKLLLHDFDADKRPDIVGALHRRSDGAPSIRVWSATGRELWRTAVPAPRIRFPDERSVVADAGIGLLLDANVKGVPRGVEYFAVLNERTGPRSWLCSIDPDHTDPNAAINVWGREPLGHIQSVVLAHRPNAQGDDTYSVLSWSMANLGGSSNVAVDAGGNATPFEAMEWDCVPCVSLHRPIGVESHVPEHTVLFQVPARDASRARVLPPRTSLEYDDYAFEDGQAAERSAVLVVRNMRFEGDQDRGPETRIFVTLTHHANGNVQGSWDIELDGTLALQKCTTNTPPVNSPWTAARIEAAWHRVQRAQ